MKRVIGGTLIIRLFSVGSTFMASVLLARWLGAESFGIYSFVFAIITLMALPCQVGIPVLLVRETAKFDAQGQWGKMKGLWLWSGVTIVAISLSITFVALLFIANKQFANDKNYALTFLIGLALVPVIALSNSRSAALRGLRKIIKGQIPEALIRPGLFLGFIFLSWVILGKGTSSGVMLLHLLSATIAFLLGGYLLIKETPRGVFSAKADFSSRSQWFRSAMPLAIIGGLQVLSNQIGIVLLGFFQEEFSVGIYKVAVSVSTIMAFGLQIMNMIFSPYIARYYKNNENEKMQKISTLGAVLGFLVALPIFFIILFWSEVIVTFVYGDEFLLVSSPLMILAFGQLVNTFFGSCGTILNMTGNEKKAARWLLISSGSNVGISIALIPFLGVVGAALATCFSIILWNLAFWVLAKRATGIDGSIISALKVTK